ncbi:MAG: HNH endonuclease [bacterium]
MAASKDGHAFNCRACASKQYSKWRTENKEKIKADKAAYHAANRAKLNAISAAWVAANKEHNKLRQAQYRSTRRETAKANSVEWRANNTAQSRATVKAWRAANPEKAKAIHAAFHDANPDAKRIYHSNRRARKSANGGKLSKGLAVKLFKLQRGKCACCGESLGKDYHLDHQMPLALGGENIDSNMQLLRSMCNMSKNAKHPVEFMQERGFLL